MSVSHTPNKIGEIFRSLYKRQQETSKMATYIYETDLLNFDVQVIAQQCNCVGKSLKGLSEQIASRYPFANFNKNWYELELPHEVEVSLLAHIKDLDQLF